MLVRASVDALMGIKVSEETAAGGRDRIQSPLVLNPWVLPALLP